ncbi:hypothetical protein HK105_201412 [Polyrhizophydium stewartii]|uniref:Uncharacterized protein n=1 Tax=Polyrhizophydium stewartii TaxID=2732419 RepID=A0ABR4NI51_9FUNG
MNLREERIARLRKAVKYRAYQSYRPCANKLLQMKIDKETKDLHDRKLLHVMPRINTAPPRKYIVSRAKQIKDQQEKMAQIEASNRVLLKRILYQQKSRKSIGKKLKVFKTPVEGRGLNGPRKKVVEQQIMEENRAILARLESQRAHYARMRWEEERRQNLFYLANIANHPIPFIEEIEELGLVRKAVPHKIVGDPYRPATAPAEIQQLLALKQQILEQVQRERQTLDVPERWQPRIPSLPRVAELLAKKAAQINPPVVKRPKVIGPLIPRVALLAMDRIKKPVVEVKEPVSISKAWTPTIVAQVEHKILFARFKSDSKIAKRESRRTSSRPRSPKRESRAPSLAASQHAVPPAADPVAAPHETSPRGSLGSLHGHSQASLGAHTPTHRSGNLLEDDLRNGVMSSGDLLQEIMPAAVGQLNVEHTVEAVVTGVPGLALSYPLPEPASRTVWLFFSSTTEDTVAERDVFMEKCVPDLRNLCRSRGLEFRCVEILGGSVHEALVNTHQITKVYMRELERCLRESAAVSFLTVLGDRYGTRTLPPEIPASIFNMLVKEIKAMGDDAHAGISTLLKWYRLDENMVPPHRILIPVTSEFSDFVNDGDPDRKAQAKHDWETKVLQPLLFDLKMAALALGEQDKLSSNIVQQFAQSLTHEEVIRGIYNQRVDPSANRVLGKAVVVFRNRSSRRNSNAERDQEQLFMDSLKNVVRDWIPKHNLIVETVPESWNAHGDNSRQESYMQRIAHNMVDAVSASIIYHADMLHNVDTPSALVDEVLHHIRFVKARSREFVRREHLVERITTYMTQTKMNRVLPLVVCGAPGTGKAGVIARSLQKVAADLYMAQRRAAEIAKKNAAEQLSSSGNGGAESGAHSGHSGSKPVHSLGAQSASFRRKSTAAPSRGSALRHDSSDGAATRSSAPGSAGLSHLPPLHGQPAEPHPVLVFRCIGSSHQSSSTSTVMLSIAAQVMQAYGVSSTSPQYEEPLTKFRRALKLPTRDRPLVLVLTKLDRLRFEHPSETSMGWLLDDLLPFINLVISVRDGRAPDSLFPSITAKIAQLVPAAQNELREKKGTIDMTKWTLPVIPEQSIVPIGDFIPTVAKVALKRYLGLDARRLRPEQEEAVMSAFERASMLDLQHTGTASPMLLRLLYNTSRAWRSYDHVPTSLPISVPQTIEHIFLMLEKEYGVGVVGTVAATITLSRDGLASTELEDILSLDDAILERTILVRCLDVPAYRTMADGHMLTMIWPSQWSTARVTRISPVFFLSLLNALRDTGLIVSQLGPGAMHLLTWSDPEFAECARSKYVPTKTEQIQHATLLSDYFSGRFHVKKPFSEALRKDGPVLAEHRGVPEQPTKLTEAALLSGRWAERRAAWNTRKIRELPNALAMAHRWDDLLETLYDIEIVEGMREATGIGEAIRVISELTEYGASQGMPVPAQEAIKNVIEFLRERADQIQRTPTHLLPGYMFDQLLRVPDDHPLTRLGKPMRLVRPDNAWQYYGRVQCVRPFMPLFRYGLREAPPMQETPLHPTPLLASEVSPVTFYPSRTSMVEPLPQTTAPVVVDIFDEDTPETAVHWTPPRVAPSMALFLAGTSRMLLSRCGTLSVFVNAEGRVSVRQNATLHETHTLAHGTPVSAVSISHNSRLLMTTTGQPPDTRILVWSLADGRLLRTVKARHLGFNASTITSCGMLIAASDETATAAHRAYAIDSGGLLKVFSVEHNKLLSTYNCERGEIVSQILPDGKSVIIGGRGVCLFNALVGVDAWDQKLLPGEGVFRHHAVRQIRHNYDGSAIYTLSTIDVAAGLQARGDVDWRSVIHWWNPAQGHSKMVLAVDDQLAAFSVSPDGRFMCTGGALNTVRLWAMPSGGTPVCVAERRTVDVIIACEIGGEVTVTRVPEPPRSAPPHRGRPRTAQGLRKQRARKAMSASTAGAGSGLVRNAGGGSVMDPASRTGSSGAVHAIAAAAGSSDSLTGSAEQINAGTPSLLTVFASSQDGYTRIWKVPAAREVQATTPHVNSLCLSPEGDCVIMSATMRTPRGEAAGSTITVYDAHSGRRLFTIPAAPECAWLSVSRSGTVGRDMVVFGGTAAGRVCMWAWPAVLAPDAGSGSGAGDAGAGDTSSSDSDEDADSSKPDDSRGSDDAPQVRFSMPRRLSRLSESISTAQRTLVAVVGDHTGAAATSRVPIVRREAGRWRSETLIRQFHVVEPGRRGVSVVGYALQAGLGVIAVATRTTTGDVIENATAREAISVRLWNVHTGEQVHEARIKADGLSCSAGRYSLTRPFGLSWSRQDSGLFDRLTKTDASDLPDPAVFVFASEKLFVSARVEPARSPGFTSLVLQRSQGRCITAVAQCPQNPLFSAVAFGDQICVVRETPSEMGSATCTRQITCSFKETIVALAMIDDGIGQTVIAATSAGTVCVYDLVTGERRRSVMVSSSFRGATSIGGAGSGGVGVADTQAGISSSGTTGTSTGSEECACWTAGVPLVAMSVSETPSVRDQCWRIGLVGAGGFAALLRLRL